MTDKKMNSLRYYHFGATLLALGIAMMAVYIVLNVQTVTGKNFKETQCNQGLLVLATHDIWSEGLDRCSPEIRKALREKYQR